MAFAAKQKSEKGPLTLKELLKQAEKTFDKRNPDLVHDVSKIIERVPTGSLACDIASGGGWPKGRVSEVFGFEQSGKSALVYATAGLLQAQGKRSIIIDAEKSFDPHIARKAYGLEADGNLCSVFRPMSIEEATELFQDLVCRLDWLDFLAFDSTAAMLPKGWLEGNPEDSAIPGLHARKVSLLLGKVNNFALSRNIPVVFVNQMRAKITTDRFEVDPGTGAGVSQTEKYTVSGGHASRFFMSLRMRVDNVGRLYDEMAKSSITGEIEKVRCGHKLRFLTVKSRVGTALGKYDGAFYYDLPGQKPGFGNDRDLLDLLKKRGNIAQRGSRFEYHGVNVENWTNVGRKEESEALFLSRPDLLADAQLIVRQIFQDKSKHESVVDPIRMGVDVSDDDLIEPGRLEVQELTGMDIPSENGDEDEVVPRSRTGS